MILSKVRVDKDADDNDEGYWDGSHIKSLDKFNKIQAIAFIVPKEGEILDGAGGGGGGGDVIGDEYGIMVGVMAAAGNSLVTVAAAVVSAVVILFEWTPISCNK